MPGLQTSPPASSNQNPTRPITPDQQQPSTVDQTQTSPAVLHEQPPQRLPPSHRLETLIRRQIHRVELLSHDLHTITTDIANLNEAAHLHMDAIGEHYYNIQRLRQNAETTDARHDALATTTSMHVGRNTDHIEQLRADAEHTEPRLADLERSSDIIFRNSDHIEQLRDDADTLESRIRDLENVTDSVQSIQGNVYRCMNGLQLGIERSTAAVFAQRELIELTREELKTEVAGLTTTKNWYGQRLNRLETGDSTRWGLMEERMAALEKERGEDKNKIKELEAQVEKMALDNHTQLAES
ncbi:hypothetical protein B0J11DRAFT_578111 [Dendryphion nanum]|uniref:Uncharacterized protein n=1 Tax=Dendryphion nanum TaxID=256645 RepID=A0A9P9E368_9PLEO|nr:hypothetical protein B0J11DRAFT_578111 [Dendryphion nanum]